MSPPLHPRRCPRANLFDEMSRRGKPSQYSQTLGRSFADSPMGSISHGAQLRRSFRTDGSEVLITRARRRRPRRLLAESSELSANPCEASVQDLAACPNEWADWANLTSDLVEDIVGRLLSHDVLDYYTFRAVCRPWRDHSAHLRARAAGALDRRFRPRNWVVLTCSPDAGPRRRVLNIATAASLSINLPALTTHCHLGAVDGLLLLFHRPTRTIRLLDPLSQTVTDFPRISSLVVNASPTMAVHCSMFFRDPSTSVTGQSVNGACLDESTSPPTLVLRLMYNQSSIIVAKPGDPHWKLVNQGKLYHSAALGRIMFHSLLSHGGRCYVATLEGSIFLLELGSLPPRVVEIISQRQDAKSDAILCKHILSYLVGGSNGRMLLVRCWRKLEHFNGRGACNQMQLFTVGGVTGRIEVSEVDIAGRTLIPVRSLGDYAAFVGMTHCMLVSSKTFPSIVADAIYLGSSYEIIQKLSMSIYYLKTGRAELLHEFQFDESQGVVPFATLCNLDQYLVYYVDRIHRLSGPCINRVAHYY